MSEHLIEFEPLCKEGPSRNGESILDSAQRMGIGLAGLCGGAGKCKNCKIRIIEGTVSELTPAQREVFSEEELDGGWRLACQTYPKVPCKVFVPLEAITSSQRLQVEGLEIGFPLDLPLNTVACELKPPSLTEPVPDAENLLEEINIQGPIHIDHYVLRDLSIRLREWKWRLTAHVRQGEVIGICPPDSRPLGLAVDLGSSKIAGYLIDLNSGRTLAAKGILNPQVSRGDDIITRISFAIRTPGGRGTMEELATVALKELAKSLCAEIGAETGDILEAVVVCNTAMHHLMLGFPVRQLASSPFVPVETGDLNVKARDIGLDFIPGAYLYFPPLIAGFIGSDHVAALTATADHWKNETALLVDIGTNTEISLITPGKITSVSCASGPVFEGYHIENGVRASKGAIEKVSLSGDSVHFRTIDDVDPIGICGSGILDAISQLCSAGVLDRRGHMTEGSHPGVVNRKGQLEFELVPGKEGRGNHRISITQKDVREVQLGKAAIQAAMKIIIAHNNISENDIDRVILAGAFGNYLDISNAIAIGLLPSLPLTKFLQVGNAAGIGAKLLLLSSTKRIEAKDLCSRIKYIELAGTPGYTEAFLHACYLEPYHLNRDAVRD